MTAPTVTDDWKRSFGQVAPIGHLCREALHDRWLRIHSLPEAKRYPETRAERGELLARQNTVATATLGSDATCTVFVYDFGERYPTADSLVPNAPPLVWLPELASLAKDYETLRIGAFPVRWRAGAFDSVLLARADDRVGPTMFANLSRGTAYAPYDGGADLFLESSSAVREHHALWANWLSSRADGL